MVDCPIRINPDSFIRRKNKIEKEKHKCEKNWWRKQVRKGYERKKQKNNTKKKKENNKDINNNNNNKDIK